MNIYYFDIWDHDNAFHDDEGTHLRSRSEIPAQAMLVLPELAKEKLPDGNSLSFTVRVRTAEGHYVYEASLRLEGHWSD